MSAIRVLLADDHTLVRAGIRSLLEKISHVEVVAEASDGREAVSLAKAVEPNVVLMDIGMPGLNGLEATARLVRECGSVRVIILSMHSNEEYVLRAAQAGASGYLLKTSAAGELETALRAVAQGQTHYDSELSDRITGRGSLQIAELRTPFERLTPRQREVWQLIVEGKNTKEIASIMDLSSKTVEFHRVQLMHRLNIHDIPGLVRSAIQTGLIQLDSPSPRSHLRSDTGGTGPEIT